MTNYKLTYHPSENDFTVALPLSKSESNRLLMIAAIGGVSPTLLKVSKCDDTDAMLQGLTTSEKKVNIGAAGTAMRFLTAYFANNPSSGEIILDGSERMRCRPIEPLVTALRQLGAQIDYINNEGFPPLKISGCKLHGGEIQMNASVSSQYISALMMIGCTLSESLTIRFNDKPVSYPYINMTAEMMRRCGAAVSLSDTSVTIHPGKYQLNGMEVEPDWSAASYWYEIAALSGRKIFLKGLKQDSLQGDSGIVGIFKILGVDTLFSKDGATLVPTGCDRAPIEINMEDMPDVAQTVAVTAAMLNKPFHITGLSTLPSKETDRLEALRCELAKLGVRTTVTADSISWDGTVGKSSFTIEIDTYRDHRMAMAFAPVAIIRNGLIINDIEVVSKSYPDFWEHLSKFGFTYAS